MGDFDKFMIAIKNHNFEDVKMLMKEEYINMYDETGFTALHEACYYGDIDIIIYLLNKGWNMEAKDHNNQYMPIHIAAINNHILVVKELINRECLLNETDLEGMTALDYAISRNNEECAIILRLAMKVQPKETLPSLTKYKKEAFIGQGGFGKVYKCFDEKIMKYFAMKEVPIISNSQVNISVISLENEIKIFKQLSQHPNIVQYYGSIREEYSMFISMQYIEGGSIRDKLDKETALTINNVAWFTKNILEGLKFLHKNNIIHRDIKAANILIDMDDTVKLSDFGTSKYLETISSHSLTNTGGNNGRAMANTFCGSTFWMAPEVICEEKHTFSADIWSLGATIVEMLTGKPPYYDLGPYAALFKIGTTKTVEYTSPDSTPRDLLTLLDSIFISDKYKRADISTLLESDFIKKFSCRDMEPNGAASLS